MSDLSQLLTAAAALITAIGSAVAAIIVAIRSGNKQAQVASDRTAKLGAAERSKQPSTKLGQAMAGMDPAEVKKVLDAISHMPGMSSGHQGKKHGHQNDDDDSDDQSYEPEDYEDPTDRETFT